ncbi:MAG: YitT family protein [Rhodobacteraceae bacterium]|nr:YitT family protein [Paracoccaceae bacterium]
MTEQHSTEHSTFEDIQGIVSGTLLAAFSLVILSHLGLITGQTAGVALLLSYWTGWSFSLIFFVINLPFYALAMLRMGREFTIKTFIAVAMITVLTAVAADHIRFDYITPAVGAVIAGVIAGTGLIALFRHKSSLGGIGILAIYLQDTFGFRAGYTQLIVDVAIFGLAFLVIPASAVLYSFLGAAVVNMVIAVNHRTDRYIAR